MLKHFKQVSLLLAAGAMVLPISAYADLAPEKLETAISQQNGKVHNALQQRNFYFHHSA